MTTPLHMSSKPISPFSVLDSDHHFFLKPYEPEDVFKGNLRLSQCEVLLKKIHQLCDKYDVINHQRKAAQVIRKCLSSLRDKRIFKNLQKTLISLKAKDPKSLLKQVNIIHSEIYEKGLWKVVFRLDGVQFPPKIVYKLICVCSDVYLNPICTLPLYRTCYEESGGKWHEFGAYRCSVCKLTTTPSLKNPQDRKEYKKIKTKRSTRKKHWIDIIY